MSKVPTNVRALSSCVGKKTFATFTQAKKVCARTNDIKRRGAYHCIVCGKFHIGSPNVKFISVKKSIQIKHINQYYMEA